MDFLKYGMLYLDLVITLLIVISIPIFVVVVFLGIAKREGTDGRLGTSASKPENFIWLIRGPYSPFADRTD